jgi:transposase
MQIAVLGIDLGKNNCSVVGLDMAGRVVLRRRLHRDGVIKLAAGMSGCVMAMQGLCHGNCGLGGEGATTVPVT